MRKFLLLVLLALSIGVRGYAQPLSPSARISLLICAPGDEIYSYFGHAAIRIYDPVFDRDIVFNYGLFSFDTPHFIWRFAKGETDYQLGVQRMSSFMREYHEDQRKVVSYELQLTPAERQALYDALVENYKPENRIYRYSHFADNCATRVRDQLEKAVAGKIKYDTTDDKVMSFRELIDLYLQDNSWSGLGIKLALGLPTDQHASFAQKMFLPDYLGNAMAKAVVIREEATSPRNTDMASWNGKLVGSTAVTTPLTGEPVVVYDAPAFVRHFSLLSPGVIILFLFVLVIALTVLEYKSKKRFVWLDVLVLLSFGIAGLILYFTTFISVMPSTKWNLNLIWAFPVHFLVALLWIFPSLRAKLHWYMQLTSAILLLFLATFIFLPQTFHWLVVPLCVILLLRTSTLSQFSILAKK